MTYQSMKEIIPDLPGMIVHVANLDLKELYGTLAAYDFDLYIIDGLSVFSEESFFSHVESVFGFGENFGHGWASWDDALGDFAVTCANRVAVLWKDANVTFRTAPQTFIQAICDLYQLAHFMALGDVRGSRSSNVAKQLEIFILGSGTGFETQGGPSTE